MRKLDLGELLDTLVEMTEFLDNYVDVNDGDYGEPRPNRAMSMQTRIDALIPLIESEWRNS